VPRDRRDDREGTTMYKGTVGILLYVRNVERSVRFYRDVMGFDFKGYWDDANHRTVMDYADAGKPSFAEVTVLGCGIGLHIARPEQAIGSGAQHHLSVDDVGTAYAHLTNAGARATVPKRQEWGATMFEVTDPDGHVWNILGP
jgi:uncharacterized glyoxalase superfamily protein PhnB